MTLRIVQLTDLHLGPRLNDKRWDAFKGLLADLPAITGGFDRLVLTGDLAAHGQRVVYEALRAHLAPLLSQVHLVPGNHDDGRALREIFKERTMEGGPAANFVEDLSGVRLIGLNSARPWRVSGALGSKQLSWLTDVLRGESPTIIFMHHPPLSVGAWWLDKDRLRDRKALAQVVQDRDVRGIFCGHVHQEFEGQLGSVPVWTTPSTAYQFKPHSLIPRTERRPPGFRWIEVAQGKVSTSIVRRSRFDA